MWSILYFSSYMIYNTYQAHDILPLDILIRLSQSSTSNFTWNLSNAFSKISADSQEFTFMVMSGSWFLPQWTLKFPRISPSAAICFSPLHEDSYTKLIFTFDYCKKKNIYKHNRDSIEMEDLEKYTLFLHFPWLSTVGIFLLDIFFLMFQPLAPLLSLTLYLSSLLSFIFSYQWIYAHLLVLRYLLYIFPACLFWSSLSTLC